jgi:polyferredoxin
MRRDGESVGSSERDERVTMREWFEHIEEAIESATANVKLFDKALAGMQGSYVEFLTIVALGLLAVLPIFAPRRGRQLFRHLNQIVGIAIFIFVVYTCLGVFGMIRNFHRGLNEIGRENIVALYYCAVPVTVLVTSMIFGPMFCGWICPTGALQEFASWFFSGFHRRRRTNGYKFSWPVVIMTSLIAMVFLGWMTYLSITRVFFVEDASIYWSAVLVMLLVCLIWKMGSWDRRLRRLRWVSFAVIVAAAAASLRVTSPVHFGFSKVYDPASLLSTVMVFLAALVVPHVWCRYLCPWREAIAWAGKHSVRKLITHADKCTKCGKCDGQCGVDAIESGKIDPHECHLCLKCADRCPDDAIELVDDWGSKGGKPCGK